MSEPAFEYEHVSAVFVCVSLRLIYKAADEEIGGILDKGGF